jgi:integrase
LVNKKVNNDPRQDPTVKAWVENAPPEIQRKLTRLGLYDLPLKRTVKELWDAFLKEHSEMHEPTHKTYLHTQTRFFRFFNPNELVGALTQERMKEWKQFLLEEMNYAEATVAGTITKAKTVFNWAKSQKWLAKSPLDHVGRGSYRNETNDRFVSREEYHKLLNACRCQEWRVILTLARIGGLHPNEIVTLRWSDIDKSTHRFRVFNSKLRRLERLYQREVPLFPEITEELEKLQATQKDKGEYVIHRYSGQDTHNWWRHYTLIAQRAGIETIPRPFDNMRASRATEVYNKYGAKIASVWLGHSVKTALQYYLMVTDNDYATAAGQE